jgi:hypothetical protein
VNASPQRLEQFKALQILAGQPSRNVVGLIQDVKTRWNSTAQMLERALRMREIIKAWLQTQPRLIELYPTSDEWKQIQYVMKILHPFLVYTKLLSASKTTTIHRAWSTYNRLFQHLESTELSLTRKRLPWKRNIRSALQPALEKLRKYYSRTAHPRGLFYNLANVLNPVEKLETYSTDEWLGDSDDSGITYRASYEQEFLRHYRQFYRGSESSPQPSDAPMLSYHEVDLTEDEELFRAFSTCDDISGSEEDPFASYNEAQRYLKDPRAKPKEAADLLEWWRLNQRRYPTLALMARDILAIPLAGVGVERIFSQARDVITYRRNRLTGQTISDIMVCKSHWRAQLQLFDEGEEGGTEAEELALRLAADKEDRQWVDNHMKQVISDDEGDQDDDDYNSADERASVPVSRRRISQLKRKGVGMPVRPSKKR